MACAVTVCAIPRPSDADTFLGAEIAQAAIRLIEAPLQAGGDNPQGFDCSGLAWYAHHLFGLDLPRKAQDQSRAARPVSLKALRPGDLLFFHLKDQSAARTVDHVGIYIGQGFFIHVSSTAKAVAYASLDNDYFKSRLVSAGRFWSMPLRASR